VPIKGTTTTDQARTYFSSIRARVHAGVAVILLRSISRY